MKQINCLKSIMVNQSVQIFKELQFFYVNESISALVTSKFISSEHNMQTYFLPKISQKLNESFELKNLKFLKQKFHHFKMYQRNSILYNFPLILTKE
jgi:hypothetical protein